MSQTRNQDLDVLKGIAILMVVFGHVLRGLHEKGIVYGPIFEAVDSRLYAVHVHLLFLVSGVLAYGSLGRYGAASFARTRYSAILLPLILWTYLFIGSKVLAGPFQNQPADLSDLIIWPFPGRLHLWFLWALFIIQLCVAGIWAIGHLGEERTRWVVLMIAFVLSVALLFVNMGSSAAYWLGSARNFLPFFLVGLLLAASGSVVTPLVWLKWVSVIVFFTIFACVPILHRILGWPLVSFLLCFSALWAGSRLVLWKKLVPGFVIMGTGTMAIYLLHVIFAAATREVLVGVGLTSTPLHILAGTTAGIALPLAFSAAMPIRVKQLLMLA